MAAVGEITKLQARIEYLEENRRYIQNALETVLSLGEFHATNENRSNDVVFLLGRAGKKICSIIAFESWAFYLVDEESFLFNLAHCEPPDARAGLEKEVDLLIDQGMFAWAVREKRGVMVPSQNQSEQYLLHVIASDGCIRGMFLGTLPKKKQSFADTSKTLLSIILLRVANALEDLEFCRFLENQKDILEEQVTARTKALTRSEHRLKKSMQEAKAFAKAAEQASEAKSDFLAKMSHELRTPLNGIVGMVEVALSTKLDENQKKILNIVDRESMALLKIINDILDFSKVEAGKLELEKMPFDLSMIITEVSETISPQASNKGVELNTRLAPNLPTQLIGDPFRLKQVLFNLAGNALKFTEHGQIEIIGELESDSDTDAKIKLTVKDTGIGIPKNKQAAIFEGFSQADESTTRKFGGTGLGITISNQLVALMGGALALESAENEGSAFYFSIPFEKQPVSQLRNLDRDVADIVELNSAGHMQTTAAADIIEINKNDIRILLVDDYPTNRKVARLHLSNAGYCVDVVENGRMAVERYRKNVYDIILMDIQMPVMDGYQATIQIRELEQKQADVVMQTEGADNAPQDRTPILAMTAHAYEKDKRKCLACGMDDFISKPIRRYDLLNTVERWVLGACHGSTSKTGSDNSIDSGEPMDFSTAVDEFGSEKMVFEVVDQLIKNIENQLRVMSDALVNGDLDLLRAESHSVKGGAGTIEAHPLAALAKKIEDLSQDHDNVSIEPVLNEFREEFYRLKAYVSNIKREPN
jgi:signal transduction histidine kinase/CheY-like chemotaxis protein/HPt (histidine-containing phosphotransfer) domain-containing protein